MSRRSCFLDSYTKLADSEGRIREWVYKLAPDFDHDEIGYHPSLINRAALEIGAPVVVPLDFIPVAVDPPAPLAQFELDTRWDSVVTGLNRAGNVHAVAYSFYRDQFWDPADPGWQDECPLQGIQTQWVLVW